MLPLDSAVQFVCYGRPDFGLNVSVQPSHLEVVGES
jgi:hypothetical protein